jgi:hypothetical protein
MRDHLTVAQRPVVPHNSELCNRVAAAATGLVTMLIFRSSGKANRQRVPNLLWRNKRLTTANRMTAPPSDTNRDSMLKFPDVRFVLLFECSRYTGCACVCKIIRFIGKAAPVFGNGETV